MKKTFTILCQGYETGNIGNDIYMANIDRCLRLILPNTVNIVSKPLIRPFLLRRSAKQIGKYAFSLNKIIDISAPKFLDVDLVVLSGPLISDRNGNEFIRFMEYLKYHSIPYAFLSAGSYRYSPDEVAYWTQILDQYPPIVFSSRDDFTYNAYAKYAKFSLKSVCTSLFSSINFPIAKVESLVGCWDDNNLMSYSDVLRWIHAEGYSDNFIYRPIIDPFAIGNILKLKIVRSPVPCLLSNSFLDYLAYYSQTSLMISSRVHCCAPTLSYGGEAVLVNKTGRRALFDSAGVNSRPLKADNSVSVLSISEEKIKNRYDEFMRFLASSVGEMINA